MTAPSDPRVVYAVGYFGIWRSDDGGSHWNSVAADGPSSHPVVAFAVDPSKADNLYAQVLLSYAGPELLQFIVSDDGGHSWTVAGAGFPADPMAALVVDPSDATVLYAEARSSIWKSSDSGATWSVLTGGGAPGGCTPTAVGGPPTECTALAVGGGMPSQVYAADAAGVHRSDDGGATWSLTALRTSPGEEIGQLIVASDESRTVLASSSVFEGVWTTANRGDTWSLSSAPADDVPYSLAPDYASGSRIYAGGGGGDLLESDDVGTTWRHVGPDERFGAPLGSVAVSSLRIAVVRVDWVIGEIPNVFSIQLVGPIVAPAPSEPALFSGR